MERIQFGDKTGIIFRKTPWDTDVFGIKTNEILEIYYESEKDLVAILEKFESLNLKAGVRHTTIRIDASDIVLKKNLQRFGFYYAETSLLVSLKKIKNIDFNSIIKGNLALVIPEEKDFSEIAIIARDNIHYGKFHEDQYIDLALARERYYSWINNMKKQKKEFLVFKRSNKVEAFIAYEIEKGLVSLLLGGARGENMLTYFFWSSFLTHFQKIKTEKVEALISTSNIGIMNLYSKFGFRFEKSTIGMHKHYK